MVAIGVSYLIFEERLLSKSKLAGDSTVPADNALSRSLTGIQVSHFEISPMTCFLTDADWARYPSHDHHKVERLVPAS
jgi:hypothetical protein